MSEKENLEQAIADFLAVCKVNPKALPALRKMLDCAKMVGIESAKNARMDPGNVGLRFKPPASPLPGIDIDSVFGKDPDPV